MQLQVGPTKRYDFPTGARALAKALSRKHAGRSFFELDRVLVPVNNDEVREHAPFTAVRLKRLPI